MMFEPPNLKPPSSFDKLMDKYALPILLVVVGTILAAWLFGKILIVDFNLLMFGLGIIMAFIVGYYIRYSIKTRKEFEKYIVSLKDEHDKQITAMRQEVKAAKDEFWKLVQDNTQLSEEWRENFRQYYQKDKELSAREQKERLEAVRNEFQQAIVDTKEELTKIIQSGDSNLSNWVTNHAEAHRWDKKEYKRQLEELEEKLTNKQLS